MISFRPRPLAALAAAGLLFAQPADASAQRDGGDLYGTLRGFGNRPAQAPPVRNTTFRGGGFFGGYAPGFGYGVGLRPFGAGFVPTYAGGFGYYPGGYGGVFPTQYGVNTGFAVPYGPIVATAPGAVGVGYGPLLPGAGGYGGYGYGNGYGNGYGAPVSVGIGAAGLGGVANPTGAVVGGNLGPNPAIAEGFRDEANRWRGPVNLGDAEPLPAAERPATERELADSLKEQRLGDEDFAALDYRGAARHYREAAGKAPTRGEPLYRLAFARIASGDFLEAGADLRRALELNPSLPVTGPSLVDLFGPGNALARTEAVGRLAAYARADVRDPDRLFLLAAVMHAGGDSRAREIFEAAWRLTGGRPHLRAYLDPVEVRPGAAGAGSPVPEDLEEPIEDVLPAPQPPAAS